MPIDKGKLTNEMIMMAMQCKNADELVALSKESRPFRHMLPLSRKEGR